MTQIKISRNGGFTLVEACMAITVCVLFGLAAFATNQRLLFALKSQKETTAATMVLQQRMEAIRATAFSNIASANYIQSGVVATATGSEAPLGNMTETVTISKYPDDGITAKNIIVRNAANPSGSVTSSNGTLSTTAKLLRVDVKLDWTSANGRLRTRQISTVAGIGNIGI